MSQTTNENSNSMAQNMNNQMGQNAMMDQNPIMAQNNMMLNPMIAPNNNTTNRTIIDTFNYKLTGKQEFNIKSLELYEIKI